jgi:flagellar FliL protein
MEAMMEDLTDETTPAPKKKKKGKLLLFIGLPVLLAGGGGGAAYAMGWLNVAPGGAGHEVKSDEPKLVPKSEEKRAGAGGEGGGDHGGGGEASGGGHGQPTPKGEGGDKYASSYYPLEKEFTSNLQDSVHFIQVGIAISTSYDEKVLESIKTHEIAIRSAVLMALGETSEEEVFTAPGKKAMQERLAKAINAVLKEKEGFGGVGNVYFTNFIVQ